MGKFFVLRGWYEQQPPLLIKPKKSGERNLSFVMVAEYTIIKEYSDRNSVVK